MLVGSCPIPSFVLLLTLTIRNLATLDTVKSFKFFHFEVNSNLSN